MKFFFLCFFSLLASASRDRLIHVFDTCREYGFVHTLDDHSSSITAIRFLKMPPRPGVENSVQIASCGADKSIIFRDISSDHKGGLEFTRGNHIVGKTTLYDMETDVSKPTPSSFTFKSTTHSCVVTVVEFLSGSSEIQHIFTFI